MYCFNDRKEGTTTFSAFRASGRGICPTNTAGKFTSPGS
jgi:hypothetical protein